VVNGATGVAISDLPIAALRLPLDLVTGLTRMGFESAPIKSPVPKSGASTSSLRYIAWQLDFPALNMGLAVDHRPAAAGAHDA
jgi:hypothetical protein